MGMSYLASLTFPLHNGLSIRRAAMKNKPSMGFWLAWFIAYSILDIILEAFLHSKLAWNQLPGAMEGALLGATLTWFFALFRWYKAQDRF